MSKHTPGPWTNEDGAITAEDGTVVADTHDVDDFPCISQDNTPEQMALLVSEFAANARLIAAAPDLLEACRESLRLCDGEDWLASLRDQLKVAIAKAEGAE